MSLNLIGAMEGLHMFIQLCAQVNVALLTNAKLV